MSRKVIFKITDPQGRRVIFYDDTWKHIKLRHPEITHYQRIKTTVMAPHYIVQSPLKDSLIYVDCGQLRLYFNVFTGFDEMLNECTVSTAYLTDYFPIGDMIWLQDKLKGRKPRK